MKNDTIEEEFHKLAEMQNEQLALSEREAFITQQPFPETSPEREAVITLRTAQWAQIELLRMR